MFVFVFVVNFFVDGRVELDVVLNGHVSIRFGAVFGGSDDNGTRDMG